VSQQLGILVVPNGGIYVTIRKGLFSEKCLIAKKTGAYLMPQERSVDIDEEVDFKFADFLKKNLKVLK
jgi:CMP-N-acetylneuraminic acid synthetase